MAETFTREEFWAELDALGEDRVRERIAAKIFGDGNHKRALAEEWLRKKAQERSDSLQAEQAETARSAADAAWAAAREAKAANTNARIAQAIAAIAIIISIIGLFLKTGS